jgi:hypothetical protein
MLPQQSPGQRPGVFLSTRAELLNVRSWPKADISYCTAHVRDADRVRAEGLFKVREQEKAEGSKATADYYAGVQRIRDRTQELRRLRLARETEKKARPG